MPFRRWLALAATCLALPAFIPGAEAAPAHAEARLIACDATRPEVATIAVDDVSIGMQGLHVRASTRVYLTMRDGTRRTYALEGEANPTPVQLAANDTAAAFAYPDFACTVTYGGIVSVHNCRRNGEARACDVSVRVFGVPVAFAVSMSAQRVAPVNAAAFAPGD